MPINNNDVLKRLRFIFSFEDSEMIALFQTGGISCDRALVSNWLKKEEDLEFVELSDKELAAFLNGLIVLKRGEREGQVMLLEDDLSNNDILKKIKIALNLTTEDLIDLFALKGRKLSKGEIANFMRNKNHSKYIPLQIQYLRNFLQALQEKEIKN